MLENNIIFIVEDNKDFRQVLGRILRLKYTDVYEISSASELKEKLKVLDPHVILLDLTLEDASGLDLIPDLIGNDPLIQIIVVTGNPALDTAVEAMRLGALNYLVKPVPKSALFHAVDSAMRARAEKAAKLAAEVGERYQAGKSSRILGDSPAICAVNLLAERYGNAGTTPVLITGASGVGKEPIAEAIHKNSPRKQKPFIKINCAAIPRPLAEAEFFGYEKGAYTDARSSKKGIFELAEGGTVFLDEIGEMELEIQPKLLRVLEEKVVLPLGSERGRHVDVRIIAATNRDLAKECKKGKFREDLYFRLAVLHLEIPPLRKRMEDVPILAEFFLKEKCMELGRRFTGFSDEVLAFFNEYRWPGNVRELRNFVERLVILSEGPTIRMDHESLMGFRFYASDNNLDSSESASSSPSVGASSSSPLQTIAVMDEIVSLVELEKEYIKKALLACDRNRSECARKLGVSRSTLISKLKLYDIDQD